MEVRDETRDGGAGAEDGMRVGRGGLERDGGVVGQGKGATRAPKVAAVSPPLDRATQQRSRVRSFSQQNQIYHPLQMQPVQGERQPQAQHPKDWPQPSWLVATMGSRRIQS
jgi:hypothetical protein